MPVSKHPLITDDADRALPAVGVDRALIERLERSFQRLDEAGVRLSEVFYERLFRGRPEIRAMFPADMTAQRQKLIDALRAVVDSLRNPAGVRARLHALGRNHVGYGVEPAHYPIVRDELVGAMAEVAGDAWDDGLRQDWRAAINQVCVVMLEGAGQRMPEA